MAEKLLIASIPKAGTHLVFKLFNLINPQAKKVELPTKHPDFFVTLFSDNLRLLNDNACYGGHHIGIKENRDLAFEHKVKVLLNIRDPRNQIVSYINTIKSRYPNYTFDDLITLHITDPAFFYNKEFGFAHDAIDSMKSIKDFYDLYLEWKEYQDVCIVQFESLVGEQGGGTFGAQFNEIKKVCNFLNVKFNDAMVNSIARELWGGTASFTPKGDKIHCWKHYFNNKHKRLFKEVAGELLIDLGYEKDFDW